MTPVSERILWAAATYRARDSLLGLVPELDEASEMLCKAGEAASSQELSEMRLRIKTILKRLPIPHAIV